MNECKVSYSGTSNLFYQYGIVYGNVYRYRYLHNLGVIVNLSEKFCFEFIPDKAARIRNDLFRIRLWIRILQEGSGSTTLHAGV
jgi:hypothetical protein